MATSFDTIVVGGGAIGAACARELAATGRRVLVLEAGGNMGQAWRAAAGMLAAQIEADAADPLLTLSIASRDRYDHLATVLEDTTGIDVGLWREGIARVATDEPDALALQARVAWQQQRGYATAWLDSDELKHRWPWTGPTIGALWAPRDGALDPGRLVRALIADAERLGAAVIHDRVTSLLISNAVVGGVTGEASRYAAPEVVIAAGAWSGLIQGIPRTIPVQPVRGQMAAVEWPPGVERAILYHRDCYLLARGNEAILGSTMEQAGFDPTVTPAGLARIMAGTVALCPGLIRAKLRRSWAGLRPVTSDGLPVIGREPAVQGLWYATGHGRNGILLAGITGVLLAELMTGKEASHDVGAFAPDRFSDGEVTSS